MNESGRLAEELRRALDGNAWHGPSWREILEDLPPERAVARPIEGAHTIAEIAHHTSTWLDVVRLRLAGERPEVSEEENFPTSPPGDAHAWNVLRDRLLANGHALCESVAAFPVERLTARRPDADGTWYELISGALQHSLYHAGQVALLRKQS